MKELSTKHGFSSFSSQLIQSYQKQVHGQHLNRADIDMGLKRIGLWQFADEKGMTKKYNTQYIQDSQVLEDMINKESSVGELPPQLLQTLMWHDPQKIRQTALRFIQNPTFNRNLAKQEASKELAQKLMPPIPQEGALLLINSHTQKSLLKLYTHGKGFVTLLSQPRIFMQNNILYLSFSKLFDKSSNIIGQIAETDKEDELVYVKDVMHVKDYNNLDGIRLELAPETDDENLRDLILKLYEKTGLQKTISQQFQFNKLNKVNILQVFESWTSYRIEEIQNATRCDLQSAIARIQFELEEKLQQKQEQIVDRSVNCLEDVIQEACKQLALIRCKYRG